MNDQARGLRAPGAVGASAYPRDVEILAWVLVAVLAVALCVLGAGVWLLAARVGNRAPAEPAGDDEEFSVGQVLAVLPGASIVVRGSSGAVERASAMAVSLGLVVADHLASMELRALVAEVYRDGIIREHDVVINRPALAKGRLELRARVASLGDGSVLLLVEDLSGLRRVDTVRRDFVANVSHELKTPVGALSLLSEAVTAAAEDPDEVRRFAGRMRVECTRLTNLVADLIDLSRLQGDQPLENAKPVDVDSVVAEATDAVNQLAANDEIELVTGGETGLMVFGVEDQLVTALRNLLANAIAYSKPRTRVAVGVSERDGIVNISVTDQGSGIPQQELERIFERFYRVDRARSRVTGGTGLGLAIVKHVCANHGGDVTVWSVEDEGSTFTLRLPAIRPDTGDDVSPPELTEIAEA